jgi:hypothetical protein
MEIQLMRRVREIFERNGRRVDFKFLRRTFIYEIRFELAVREQDHSPASCWLRGASPRNLLGCKRRGLCKNNVRVNPVFRKCVRHLRKISHIVLGDFVSRLAFADRQANAMLVKTLSIEPSDPFRKGRFALRPERSPSRDVVTVRRTGLLTPHIFLDIQP